MSDYGNQSPRAKIKHYSDGERDRGNKPPKVNGMIVVNSRKRLFTLDDRAKYLQLERKRNRRQSAPAHSPGHNSLRSPRTRVEVYDGDTKGGSNTDSDTDKNHEDNYREEKNDYIAPLIPNTKSKHTPSTPNKIITIDKRGEKGERGERGEDGESGEKGERGERGLRCKCIENRHLTVIPSKSEPSIIFHALAGESVSNIDIVGTGSGKASFKLVLVGPKFKQIMDNKLKVSKSEAKLYQHIVPKEEDVSMHRIYQLTLIYDANNPKELYSFDITITKAREVNPVVEESLEESLEEDSASSESEDEPIEDKKSETKTSKLGDKVKHLRNGIVIPLLNINHRGNTMPGK